MGFLAVYALLLLATTQFANSAIDPRCVEDDQPALMCSLLNYLGRDYMQIFNKADGENGARGHTTQSCSASDQQSGYGNTCLTSLTSSIEVNEAYAVPDSVAWSRCKNCGYSSASEKFILLGALSDPSSSSSSSSSLKQVQATWSQWAEFFFTHHQDLILIDTDSTNFRFNRVVDTPVYIIPIITFHIGHILIDIVEQLYNSMMTSYGRVRLDALIVIDVAGLDERDILQDKIFINVEQTTNNIGNLLKLFTNLPILSLNSFKLIASDDGKIPGIIFRDIHFGLDNSQAFFNVGHSYHPCIFNLNSNPFLQQLSMNYQKFRDYTWNLYDYTTLIKTQNESKERKGTKVTKILFIQRGDNRIILNLEEIMRLLCNPFNAEIERLYGSLLCLSIDLSSMPIQEQMQHFSESDILVAVAGTALHNLLFFRPKTAVVIVMQPGWCEFAWMYANQAVLLDIKPFVYCDREESITATSDYSLNELDEYEKLFLNSLQKSVHWTRNYYSQGPRMMKSNNVTLSEDNFLELISYTLLYLSDEYNDEDFSCTGRTKHHEVLDYKKNQTTTGSSQISGRFFESFNLGTPVIRSYISEIDASLLEDGRFQLSFIGEIVTDFRILETLKYAYGLSLCMKSIYSKMDPWCYAIDGLNYLSYVKIAVSDPILNLHTWLQFSSKGSKSIDSEHNYNNGIGKVKGSDNFISIDLRLPNGGFAINSMVGEEYSLTIIKNAEDSVFYLKITDRFAIQRISSDFCIFENLSPSTCAQFVQTIYRDLYQRFLMKDLGLSVQTKPSPEVPFVFLHIEKTAGTTFREIISESADSLNLKYIIPCHNDLSCATFKITDLDDEDKKVIDVEKVSILAGHFAWDEWRNLPSFTKNVNYSTSFQGDRPVPPCFIIGRHPLNRAISYYYQRCYNSSVCPGFNIRLNDISERDLNHFLLADRVGGARKDGGPSIIFDDGISDSMCRVLANARVTTGMPMADDINVPIGVSPDNQITALANLDNCVLGLQERWEETLQVIKFWFPWIDTSKDPYRRKMEIYTGKEKISDLKEDIKRQILDLNQCDTDVYNKMVNKFEKQLKIIRQTDFTFPEDSQN